MTGARAVSTLNALGTSPTAHGPHPKTMHASQRKLTHLLAAAGYLVLVACSQALHLLPGLEHPPAETATCCCCHHHASHGAVSAAGQAEEPTFTDPGAEAYDCPVCSLLTSCPGESLCVIAPDHFDGAVLTKLCKRQWATVEPLPLHDARGPPSV